MSKCRQCGKPGAVGLRCETCKGKDANQAHKRRERRANEAIESEITSYEGMLDYGLELEAAAGAALIRYGSVIEASDALSISPRELRKRLSELQRRAARRGYSPAHDNTKPTPPGFVVKGTSTYYDSEGKIRNQWVKTKLEEEHRYTKMLDAVQSAFEGYTGKSPKTKPPKKSNDDLLCIYPMGDPHFGMHAWAAESGDDFDLKKAEANLFAAVDHLVSIAPPAKQALVLNLGDFFHADNKDARTARSGNPLDVDTRWAKVLRVGVETMIRVIQRTLERHEVVTVINEIGNHDDHSSIMLSLALDLFFRNNSRVTIDTSPSPFHYFRFGKCLIGVHHGHGAKPDKLGGIMSVDRAADWGETLYRHWYTGHVHHDQVKELYGCTFESFRTLASKDAWHHASGYRADRDMKCDIWHRKHGRQGRHIVGIRQIWAE